MWRNIGPRYEHWERKKVARVRPWCSDFFKAIDDEFIFRRPNATEAGFRFYIEDGTGKVMEIFRCPFCGKRHW